MNRSCDYVLWWTLVILTAVWVGDYWRNSYGVQETEGAGERWNLLSNRINPNTASWSSLARLPGIGPVRANAIVAYREGHGGGSTAFGCSDDLEKVKGIGPRTVEQMVQYLTFAEH